MKPDDESLLCLSCGEENVSGAFCSKCKAPLRIEADLLPELIQERLRLEGFQTAHSAEDVQLASALSGAFYQIEQMKLSQVLILPGLSRGRVVTTVTVAVVVRASLEATASLQALAGKMLGAIQSFVDGTNARVGSVVLHVYMIYTEGISLASMEKHRLPLRLRVRRLKRGRGFLASTVSVALKPIDGKTGQWRYLDRFGYRGPGSSLGR